MADSLFLPYTTTTNPENLRRLLRSIDQQRALDQFLGRVPTHRRTLFTDSAAPLSSDVVAFFDGGVFESDPYTLTPDGGRRFNMSLLRNTALEHGRAIAPAWTMLCDGDTVLRPAPFVPPVSPFGVPRVYYQHDAQETALQSLERLATEGDSLFADGNSWFILSRSLLGSFEFNPEYRGYGWEDVDFSWRIQGAGYPVEVTSNIVIHVHHPDSQRRRDDAGMGRNRALAKATRKLIENGVLHPHHPVPYMQVYEAHHPSWFSFLVLCPAHETLVWVNGSEDVFNFARYTWSGDRLRVQWPFHGSSTFRLVDGKLIELALLQQREGDRPPVQAGAWDAVPA